MYRRWIWGHRCCEDDADWKWHIDRCIRGAHCRRFTDYRKDIDFCPDCIAFHEATTLQDLQDKTNEILDDITTVEENLSEIQNRIAELQESLEQQTIAAQSRDLPSSEADSREMAEIADELDD